MLTRLQLFFALLPALFFSNAAIVTAATLPGWSQTCVAPNWMTGTPEQISDVNINDPTSGFWGFTSRQPGGKWLIQFNIAKMHPALTTPAVLMFLFYHECAHARFNTTDEVVADCRGLEAMKQDMTVTAGMISEIQAVYASAGRPFPSGPC